MPKELMWSECQDFVYGLKSDFSSKGEFIETVTRQYDNGPCVVKNIKVEPCIFTSEEISPDVLIPLSLTDFIIENYYTAQVEEVEIADDNDGDLSSPEIAEMHLDGTLCEQCGEYLGDPVGYPRLCKGCED